MTKRLLWMLVLVLFLLLAGCQSTSFLASCNNRTNNTVSRCDFNFDQLSGQWNRDINVSYIGKDAANLPVHLIVSVREGTVRASFLNETGERVSYDVTADTPLEASDTIQISSDQANITFEAVGQTASGVIAVVEVGEPSS